MKTLRLLGVITILMAIIAISQANAQYAYSNYKEKESTVTAYAITDLESDESGYGLSMTLKEDPTAAVTYTHLESFDMYQISKSKETKLAGYPVNLGVAVGYANNQDDTVDTPDGLVSGLEASIKLGKEDSKLSFELKACSMAEKLNPIDWLTDSDVLWVGAGVTFRF